MRQRYKGRKWYAYAVAGCIVVAFYVLLAHFGTVANSVATFIGYFRAVIMGCVLAYIMNPLAKLINRKLFARIHPDNLRWSLSVALSVIIVILVIGFLLGTLIPQLMDSAIMLVSNMDVYLSSLQGLLERWGIGDSVDLDQLMSSSGVIVQKLQSLLNNNVNYLVNTTAAAGRSVVTWIIALILSVYMLAAKDRMKRGIQHLLSTLMTKKNFVKSMKFFSRVDKILVSYIVSSLLDSAIVGVINALFMSIMGMQYVGLISVLVALANLVPTFGPIVGGAAGAFILVLIKPWHAFAFLIFTIVLQFLDGYLIKPKLFGNTLGVSGLLILVSVIVCGNIAGVVGILISIPLAAILNFLYLDVALPALERRAAKREAEAKS